MTTVDVASIIRSARERAGLSHRALAERAGTSGPAISMYESGERIPRVDTLFRIVTAAGATVDIAVAPDGADSPVDVARSAETLEQVLGLADAMPRRRDRHLEAPILGSLNR